MWAACHPKSEGEMAECHELGKSLSKLLQPTILYLLAAADEPLHGYVISQQAADSPMFGGAKPDPTGIYRQLASMEKEGLVASHWDTDKSGPAKKLYRLTDAGRRTLRRWLDSLGCYALTIGELRGAIATSLGIDLPEAPVCGDAA
ncbi:MAG: helix-turn-helix transcriptional regulator [Coriobacteriales bacterium]|jgi:DNA-binding PadR family transcriptional regulator|nr:helix-turn-helix transcriptional regulator [Coriobacteriales bacterium]